MPKRKSESIATPSEATIRLLEPARGISDVHHERIAEVVSQILMLPQTEQIAAAQWMGTQAEYAGVLAYLVGKAGVTGALRRAVKQALFELRRRGVQVSLPQEREERALVEPPSLSRAWVVEEAFAASPYRGADYVTVVHLRFFLSHASGQKAAFLLDISPDGYLVRARMVDEGVEDLYHECIEHPFVQERVRDGAIRNEFVRMPVDWALQVAHEMRQRNLRDHEPMPPHAAFYWGRLPAPPEELVAHPLDPISDAETGCFVSSLVTSYRDLSPTGRGVVMLTPYIPGPDDFGEAFQKVMEESETRLVLTPQTEEERRNQAAKKIRQLLFPDEKVRDILLYMLPICASILLLGGDRQSAVWLKAVWRELKERPDRPFYNTEIAIFLTSLSLQLFMKQEGSEIPKEGEEQANEPPILQV